jgi:hypothetical protein
MTGVDPNMTGVHPASFRDPAGFVFAVNDVFYRQVNQSYAGHYDLLIRSGLYDALTGNGLLVPHTEVAENLTGSPDRYKTLLPRQIHRISYACEWSPEQLKDAALLTLHIQQIAMDHGMTLKDAPPLNIQFEQGRPIFLDTLSFEQYDPGRPWIAYRQFCECFLFPLYLHRYLRTGTGNLVTGWPEGIPAAATARLLPPKSRWNAGAWMHVFLQSHVRSLPSSRGSAGKTSFSKTKLSNLIEHLQNLINRLTITDTKNPTWANYYSETILGKGYLESKERLFRQYLHGIEFSSALDLGCNDGWFSKILAEKGMPVLAVDSDWQCVNSLYIYNRENKQADILPLCVDLSNPTPASGFRNAERASFTDRARAGLVIALALIHHLSLGKNIPLPLIATWFHELTANYLIIEFVPLSDEKARQLIARKETEPDGYDIVSFELAFSRYFRVEMKDPIPGTDRILYRLKKDNAL